MRAILGLVAAIVLGVAPEQPGTETTAAVSAADRAGETVAGTGMTDLNTPQAAVTPWKLDAVFELPEVPEPSGLCYCELTNTIFVVDDGGPDRQSGLYEIDLEGKYLRGVQFGKDLEGVTYCGANSLLYVCDEADERVHITEPKALEVQGSFQVSRSFRGKELLQSGGNGFEGITWIGNEWQEGVCRNESGMLLLLNQDDPACFVAVDPDRIEPGTILGLKAAFVLPQRNSGEVFFDSRNGELWVVNSWLNTAERFRPETLFSHKGDGGEIAVSAWEVMPGMAQEGLTFDPQGRMWIGQDIGGVVRYVRQ